jgi:hypothetical protein
VWDVCWGVCVCVKGGGGWRGGKGLCVCVWLCFISVCGVDGLIDGSGRPCLSRCPCRARGKPPIDRSNSLTPLAASSPFNTPPPLDKTNSTEASSSSGGLGSDDEGGGSTNDNEDDEHPGNNSNNNSNSGTAVSRRPCRVVEKDVARGLARVHWVGYPASYDEWRALGDVPAGAREEGEVRGGGAWVWGLGVLLLTEWRLVENGGGGECVGGLAMMVPWGGRTWSGHNPN